MSLKLNMYLVPADPEFYPANVAIQQFNERLQKDKLADVLGDVIGTGERLVEGGLTHISLDRPSAPVAWGNKAGGFSVSCPQCSEPMVREFNEAFSAWKAGVKGREIECVGCNRKAPFDTLRFRPKAAVGRIAIALRDVGSPSITGLCVDIATELLGVEFNVVMSRG